MNQLITRTISAFAAISISFSSYYYFQKPGLIFLGFIIFSFGCYEYYNMEIKKIIPHPLGGFIYLSSCLFLLISLSLLKQEYLSLIILVFCIFISLIISLYNRRVSINDLKNYIQSSLVGFLYTAIFPSFILRLFQNENGPALLVILLSLVFSGDTAAYFGGSLFGKHKIAPQISPKKTLEGALIGWVFSILIGLYLVQEYNIQGSLWFFVLSLGLTSLIAQFGDFFESLLKRTSKIKDSGSILPGHGGVLDRMDGVYFAAPIFYFFYIAIPLFNTII